MTRRICLIGFVALCACDSQPPVITINPDPALVVDTTSVKASTGTGVVVTNPAPDTLIPAFRIEHEPLIRVGGRNDEALYQELWVVRDAVLTTDEKLVVSMDAGREVRVFDRQNRFTHTLGRQGEGPAEFRSASLLLSLPNDAVMLYDGRLLRLNVYNANGGFERWLRTRIGAVCCFADGAFLARLDDPAAMFRQEPWPAPRPTSEWAIVGGANPVVQSTEIPQSTGRRDIGRSGQRSTDARPSPEFPRRVQEPHSRAQYTCPIRAHRNRPHCR